MITTKQGRITHIKKLQKEFLNSSKPVLAKIEKIDNLCYFGNGFFFLQMTENYYPNDNLNSLIDNNLIYPSVEMFFNLDWFENKYKTTVDELFYFCRAANIVIEKTPFCYIAKDIMNADFIMSALKIGFFNVKNIQVGFKKSMMYLTSQENDNIAVIATSNHIQNEYDESVLKMLPILHIDCEII